MAWMETKYWKLTQIWRNSSKGKKILIFFCVYTLLFLITFFLAYSSFLLADKSFIWQGDGRSQHYPVVVYIGRYLRQSLLSILHGNFAIPLFDLNIGVGEDIISTLNYYGFGDPLYFFTIFIPTKYIEYFFNFCVVFRIYLSGLAFIQLCVYHKKRYAFALIGALVYIFSGYTIISAVRHPFFINPMIQFPLLLIGMDMIREHKKPFLFIFAVSYSALCGFYFLYMMTIMLAIYGFISYFSIKDIKEFLKSVLLIISYYLLGLGLVAIIFIPVVLGFLYSNRSGATINFNPFSYGFSYYQGHLLKCIAPAPTSWDSLSLAAISVFSLFMMLFTRKRYSKLKLLLCAGMIIYILPLGGYVMNGFGYPSQRWNFGLVLLLAYITVEMLPVMINMSGKDKTVCLLVLTIYTLCVLLSSKTRGVYYIVGVAMLAITFVIFLLVNNKVFFYESISIIACVVLISANVSINALYKFAPDLDKYVNQFSKSGYETEIMKNTIEREAEPYLDKKDGRFYGIDFSYNRNMIWRVPTTYSYWSMINANTAEFWKQTENIGQVHADCVLSGFDGRFFLGSLLSNKYYISFPEKNQNVPYGYFFIKETEKGNFIYENQYVLPWGYTYDNYMTYEEVKSFNGLEKEEAMLQSIILEQKVDYISIGNLESNIENIDYTILEQKDLDWHDGVIKVNKANGTMTIDLKIPQNANVFLRLYNLNIDNSKRTQFSIAVKCGDVSKKADVLSNTYAWHYGRENYLFNLGYIDDEHISCTITFPVTGTFMLEDIQLYALPLDKYPEQIESLRAEPLENIKWETNMVSGTVNLSSNKVLCMSIPYSKGWSAKVDGEPTEILRGNYMFMALPLKTGYHEIEFTYCSPGLKIGCIISSLSLLVMILLLYGYKKGKTYEESCK